MLQVSGNSQTGAIKFEGSRLRGGEVNFPTAFGRCARAIWPQKTAFKLAAIGNVSDRAAKDWLSGKVPAPAVVIAAMVVEITRRSNP